MGFLIVGDGDIENADKVSSAGMWTDFYDWIVQQNATGKYLETYRFCEEGHYENEDNTLLALALKAELKALRSLADPIIIQPVIDTILKKINKSECNLAIINP